MKCVRKITQWMLAVAVVLSVGAARAEATPLSYSFVIKDAAAVVFGTGSFSLDSSALADNFASKAELTSFTYTDPVINPTGTTPFVLSDPNLVIQFFTTGAGFTPFQFTFQDSNVTHWVSVNAGPATQSFTAGAVIVNFNTGQSRNFAPAVTGGSGLNLPTGPTSPTPVPEPTSMLLLGTGMVAMIAYRRRQR